MGERVPEDRCGYVSEKSLPADLGGICCWRPIWKDDACIWHSKKKAKPTLDLMNSRSEKPERLDNAYLHSVSLPEISFDKCVLFKSNFKESKLTGATFDGADARLSNFEGATMSKADLSNSDFSLTNMMNVDLYSSNISHTKVKGSKLQGASMISSSIYNSKFFNSNLSSTNLLEAELIQSDFFDSEFRGAELTLVKSADSNFKQSYFERSKLYRVNIADSNFSEADFTDSIARDASINKSCFEDATFIRTDLRDASLKDTRLYQTLFSDARINSNTDFGEESAYEDPDIDLGENYEDTSRFEAAAWVYRRLQDLHEENAMSEQAREYHIQKEEAHRSDYWAKGQYFQWFVYTLNRYLTRHGESLKHVVAWSIGTILTCALAYPFAGGISSGNEVFRVGADAALGGLFLRSLYFSTVTFTTLGYGDYHPVGPAAKALAGAESLAGALLVALFVFVLGRRVAR